MEVSKEDIQAIKHALELAREEFCIKKNDITNVNRVIFRDALSCFSMIGKEKLYELVPQVTFFLSCCNFVLRETAVITLGLSSRLHLPEFRETAYKIWLEDEDDYVKEAALRTWVCYYHDTQDPEILKILYQILKNEKHSVLVRVDALNGIFRVSKEEPTFYDPDLSSFFQIETHQELNNKIDWDEVTNVMKTYAPEALKQK